MNILKLSKSNAFIFAGRWPLQLAWVRFYLFLSVGQLWQVVYCKNKRCRFQQVTSQYSVLPKAIANLVCTQNKIIYMPR